MESNPSRPAHSAARSESRREFLTSKAVYSAAAASAIAFPAGVHAAESAGQGTGSPNSTIRMALVGCGGRGTGAVNNSLSINGNVKLTAVADLYQTNGDRAVAGLSKRHPGKVAVDKRSMHFGLEAYQEVLNDPDIDLVLLTTSPGFRPSHIEAAIDAGKHVFAEKPVCVDPAGYKTCVAAHEKAVSKGLAVVTGTQYRRQVNYVGAIEKIREGAIGDVISATSRYCAGGTWYKNRKDGQSELDYQLYNWMHYIWLSGDQITEQAVHNIDAMNWVMGSAPESAYGSGGRFTRPEGSEMWDSMSIDYLYPGNRLLSFMCRQIPGSKSDNGNTIYGSDAIMHIGAMSSGSRITDRNGKELWSMKGSISDAYEQEHKDLVDSIRADKPIVELKQTAESSLTAVMGRMAAYSGQKVSWDFVTEKSQLDLFPSSLDQASFPGSAGFAVPAAKRLT